MAITITFAYRFDPKGLDLHLLVTAEASGYQPGQAATTDASGEAGEPAEGACYEDIKVIDVQWDDAEYGANPPTDLLPTAEELWADFSHAIWEAANDALTGEHRTGTDRRAVK